MASVDGAYVYVLRCADGSFYVGTTRKDLDARLAEHNNGLFKGYTASRRPVSLAFAEHFAHVADAIAVERQIKGWSRAKKAALAAGDWTSLKRLSMRGRHSMLVLGPPHPSRRPLRGLLRMRWIEAY